MRLRDETRDVEAQSEAFRRMQTGPRAKVAFEYASEVFAWDADPLIDDHDGGERTSPLAALPALPMSEILYECNELDRAQELITHSLPNANEFGFVDHLMPGYITSARIKHARGDLTGAQQTLDEGMGVAMALVNELAARFHCSRVALGWSDGPYVRARAISGSEDAASAPSLELVEELKLLEARGALRAEAARLAAERRASDAARNHVNR